MPDFNVYDGAHMLWTVFYYWLYLSLWCTVITILGQLYLFHVYWGFPWWITPHGWYHKIHWKTRYLWDKHYRDFKRGCKRHDQKKLYAMTKFANKYGGTVTKTGKY